MRVRLKDLKRIIREEVATIDSDRIAQTVMDVLSDEGGAASIEPIEDALEDLEGDEELLPDTDLEELIKAVPGVKQHKDGDYIDSTELSERLTHSKLYVDLTDEQDNALSLLADAVSEAIRVGTSRMDILDTINNELDLMRFDR